VKVREKERGRESRSGEPIGKIMNSCMARPFPKKNEKRAWERAGRKERKGKKHRHGILR